MAAHWSSLSACRVEEERAPVAVVGEHRDDTGSRASSPTPSGSPPRRPLRGEGRPTPSPGACRARPPRCAQARRAETRARNPGRARSARRAARWCTAHGRACARCVRAAGQRPRWTRRSVGKREEPAHTLREGCASVQSFTLACSGERRQPRSRTRSTRRVNVPPCRALAPRLPRPPCPA